MLEKEVAGLFCVAPPPGPLKPEELEAITSLGLRNFIFFAEHFKSGPHWQKLKETLKEKAPPGLWAVDQEGGRVCRIKPPLFPVLKAPLELAKEKAPAKVVFETARNCARHLKALGLNLNLAPVLDLAGPEAPSFLRARTFGEDAEQVAKLGAAYVKAFKAEGIGSTAKHFPGLGGVEKDPHKELPVKKEITEEDLLPFKAAIKVGVPCVMTTHLLVPSFSETPVTYSARFIRFLREELGFKGLILTDDLFMGGAQAGVKLEEAVLRAFLAGHDLLLLCGEFKRSLAVITSFLEETRASVKLRQLILERRSHLLLPVEN